MNRRLLIIVLMACLLPLGMQAQQGTFRFAQLTDIHLTPNNPNPTEDLLRSVAQINATDSIDFVLVTGDLTEEGDRTTMEKVKSCLDLLKVPYHVVLGNQQDILQGVLDSVAADETYGADRILVVWGRGYHQGVIGIVASRVVERFGKPAIIVSVDENGEGKGSGRSIAGVSLYNAIAACGDLLIRFGGHALAAGLSVREENLPAFRKAVNAWAAQEHPVLKRPALRLDAPLALSGLKEEDVAALSVLAPFGHGNPTPVFLVENAVIDAVYPLSEGKHTRLRLKQGGGVLYAAVFGQGPGALGYNVGDAVDAAVCLSVFEGKNGPMISARIKELRPAGLDEAYLEGTELYEALMCGAPLTESQRRALLPARADTVALYRAVGAARDGVPAGDLRPLFAKLGARGAGKALVSLEALRELSLLEQRETPQGARWCLVPAAGKKDLASAPILRRLEAAQ